MKKFLLSLIIALGLTPLAHAADDATGYVAPSLAHAPFGTVRLVVPVTSADPDLWFFKLRNANAALDAAEKFGGKAEVKFVVYGPGLMMLKDHDGRIGEAVTRLRARGVQFLVCNNTLIGMNLDYHTLNGVPDADVVPSGFLEVAWLQQAKGYSVDPSN